MRRIVFIVYPEFELLDMSGPVAVFNGANRALAAHGEPLCYSVELASAAGGPVASSSGVVVHTRSLDDAAVQAVDTLLVVGAEREPLLQTMEDPILRKTLPALAHQAKRLGSICTGAFILAGLGLLDGHRVATHWDGCAPLAQAFPALNVDAEALYVEDGRYWTSAGVTTGIDMALAMVAYDLSAAIVGEVAKRLVLYARRPGHQSQFSSLLQAQTKADSPFADLIAWIQAHLDAPLDVTVLSEHAGLSARTFHRKFVAATGATPARFVETARLDAARLLLTRGVPLKSVAARVGLFPAARLNNVFERRFGISPRLFRDMHASL
ncbi:GlxA family transcriptional regulator [Pollutimonas harenae]|uniref:DJ-1/PfpI family protein n=1 Tax=Pollutimonas harenae TaxID=657015 RepID=A0A853GZM7_9BURK|nr:DJ-1/PfpI family protein [Pollutimonas harenae]NYT85220.1 DJ-1/PfpI family protein [Pollutimonas harenae]TEA72409.1 helix-turn-helix domain-containing protein [Pollutimonas harenae]